MSNNVVMAFSPRIIVGCLLKKTYKGRGSTGTPGAPPPPLATLLIGLGWPKLNLHVWYAEQQNVTCKSTKYRAAYLITWVHPLKN